MGTGSSTRARAYSDQTQLNTPRTDTRNKASSSTRSPAVRVDSNVAPSSRNASPIADRPDFSSTRCADHSFVRTTDVPALAHLRANPGSPVYAVDPLSIASRKSSTSMYPTSKHSMVFEDEGGAPSNIDARIHRSFKLDMREAFKDIAAEVVEVCHRLDNGTLIILYRVHHPVKIPPPRIGALADAAEMDATWHMLDVYRQENLSRCNSDATMRRKGSSRSKKRFPSEVFGPLLDSPTDEASNTNRAAARPSQRADDDEADASESSTREPLNFYACYVQALDGEQRRLSLGTGPNGKKPRPAPVDPEYYVQQLYAYTRMQTDTPCFLDETQQPRQLHRTCEWHVLPMTAAPVPRGSFGLSAPLQSDMTGPAGNRTARSSEDIRSGSCSTLNILSSSSQLSSVKDSGVKPAPPILVTNSSFRLDSSLSSLPQWGESNGHVKLRLPRKSSVSFIVRDGQEKSSDARAPQQGSNTVAQNQNHSVSLEETMSFLSDFIFSD